MRFNSTEEICYYKAGVVGSIPTAATKLVRNSIGLRVPVFYTGSCEFESHRANKMSERDFERLIGFERINIHLIILIHPNHRSDKNG